jgi:hypothetical protein
MPDKLKHAAAQRPIFASDFQLLKAGAIFQNIEA